MMNQDDYPRTVGVGGGGWSLWPPALHAVLHHPSVYLFVSVHPLRQLLDARRTKVCSYVCPARRSTNIESPSLATCVSEPVIFLSFPSSIYL